MTEFTEIAKLQAPVIFASTIKPKNIPIPDNIPIITSDNRLAGKNGSRTPYELRI
jgi:hypothetical protein